MLTGEALPVAKRPGDQVIGGTMNKEGMIRIRATHVGADTGTPSYSLFQVISRNSKDVSLALSRIVQLVEEAQTQKAPIQAIADKISRFFVPTILLLASITFSVWFALVMSGVVPSSWVPR